MIEKTEKNTAMVLKKLQSNETLDSSKLEGTRNNSPQKKKQKNELILSKKFSLEQINENPSKFSQLNDITKPAEKKMRNSILKNPEIKKNYLGNYKTRKSKRVSFKPELLIHKIENIRYVPEAKTTCFCIIF